MAFFNNNNYISLLSQMCQKWNVFRITNNLSLKIVFTKRNYKAMETLSWIASNGRKCHDLFWIIWLSVFFNSECLLQFVTQLILSSSLTCECHSYTQKYIQWLAQKARYTKRNSYKKFKSIVTKREKNVNKSLTSFLEDPIEVWTSRPSKFREREPCL